ncbi:hypothetical protein NQ317_014424 [Molorchus minor]|uniref:Uncharacterized protein n=1 Tax=Molorchus minor TaxID=1323400 RepID=A0ABQ9K577_9CUCU|nr:hypothetical protein NQ317_014424 [Molorchus minor]
MAASNNYYPAVAHYASHVGSVQVRLEDPCAANLHEIQHLVSEGPEDTPLTYLPYRRVIWIPSLVNAFPLSQWNGGEEFPNGHVNGSAKPYMNGHISNGHVHITENPQFFAFEGNGNAGRRNPKHSVPLRYEEDSNSNCNPHFEQNVSRFRNSTSSLQSLDSNGDIPLNDKQSTCLDDTLGVSVVNSRKRISPVLGPNG